MSCYGSGCTKQFTCFQFPVTRCDGCYYCPHIYVTAAAVTNSNDSESSDLQKGTLLASMALALIDD